MYSWAEAAASYGLAVRAVLELQEKGTPNYWEAAASAHEYMLDAFVKP